MSSSRPPLILASASPQRRALLATLRARFEVRPAPLTEPETPPAGCPPEQWACWLAEFKARAVAELEPGRWILGADTLVVCAGELLNKPRDLADARRMLAQQAGVETRVITGVCLLMGGATTPDFCTAVTTRVWMRDDPAAREAYLAGGDWAGKAGAYGIQTVGDRLVARIEGSFSNVVGLPLELLAHELAARGLCPAKPPSHELTAPGAKGAIGATGATEAKGTTEAKGATETKGASRASGATGDSA